MQPSARARDWMRTFESGGLEAMLDALRAEAARAAPPDLTRLARALRYLHQVLLPDDAARALHLALALDEPPGRTRPPAATARSAALERERARLTERLASWEPREAALLAAADERDRLLDDERALAAEVADLEARIAAEEARDE